jgi:histidinol dehydrogenase
MTNKFAVITGDEVLNIIVAETKEIAESVTSLTCVEIEESSPVAIGTKYDGENFIFPAGPVDDGTAVALD